MLKPIATYGLALAGLVLFLSLLEYYYQIRFIPVELYVVAIALLFTGLGIWVGRKLTQPSASPDPFHRNNKAIGSLGITDREIEVLELVSEGLSNEQIADRLYISIHTVKSHISSLLGKLDAARRTQAIKKAKSLRIIP